MAKKKEPKPLYAGDAVDGMDPPNHMVPLLHEPDNREYRWPLLRLRYVDAESGDHCGLFFDAYHGDGHWEWSDRAPTWMDPELFLRMCKKDPRVGRILAEAFKQNQTGPATRKLPEILDELFDEVYLPYVIEHFEEARDCLIQWMVRNYAYIKTDPTKKKRRSKQTDGT